LISRRGILAGLAVVAAGVAVSIAPASARGGPGGHVGFVHGFVARGGRMAATANLDRWAADRGGFRAGVVIALPPAGVINRRVRDGVIGQRPFASCFATGRIRQRVIPVLFSVGPAAIIPPLGQPSAVASFVDPPVGGPSPVRLPLVMTPGCGSRASAGGSTFYNPAVVTAPVPVSVPVPVAAVPDSDATHAGAGVTSLPAACRAVPNGYHCDWPS